MLPLDLQGSIRSIIENIITVLNALKETETKALKKAGKKEIKHSDDDDDYEDDDEEDDDYEDDDDNEDDEDEMEEDAEDEVNEGAIGEPTVDSNEEEKGKESRSTKIKDAKLGFKDDDTDSGGEDELDELVRYLWFILDLV